MAPRAKEIRRFGMCSTKDMAGLERGVLVEIAPETAQKRLPFQSGTGS
jgi:hypothetical protein